MGGSGSRISKKGSETLTIVKENQIPQVDERERIQFSTTKSCFQQVWKMLRQTIKSGNKKRKYSNH